MLSIAYSIGMKSALDISKSITDNPYEFGTTENYEWFMGFDYVSKKLLDIEDSKEMIVNNSYKEKQELLMEIGE